MSTTQLDGLHMITQGGARTEEDYTNNRHNHMMCIRGRRISKDQIWTIDTTKVVVFALPSGEKIPVSPYKSMALKGERMTASHALSHLSYSPSLLLEDTKSTGAIASCQEPGSCSV